MTRPMNPRQHNRETISPPGWLWLASRYAWTLRESEVAQMLQAGVEFKLIARHLKISVNTVHEHVTELYNKTRVHGRGRFADKLMRRYFEWLQLGDDVEATPPEPHRVSAPPPSTER